ncbi:hypothetical protein [Paraburkholderia sp. MM5496-R1]|uniref:hypothetical protein n=1 Tax=Paraburkholderia sp. MM5496-R1 TaxID=2991065 RepID=UPI003D1A6152
MSFPAFFIHPPKCGGSTVISFFDLNKGNDQFISFVWDQDGWGNCRAKLLETQVGGGHLPYGIHRMIKHPVNYCTILRDPLARQISHYWYAANGKNGEVTRGVSVSTPEALAQQGVLSLDEWVSESLGGKNLFVHMLSGEPVANQHEPRRCANPFARTDRHRRRLRGHERILTAALRFDWDEIAVLFRSESHQWHGEGQGSLKRRNKTKIYRGQ